MAKEAKKPKVLAGDCLPKGGTIVLLGEPTDLLIRIDGPGAAWPQGFAACMADVATALSALTGARSVQMSLTALFAASGKLTLSPVLGPAGGIEAVRLSSPPGEPRRPATGPAKLIPETTPRFTVYS